jgi:hypothetical protein
MPQRQSLNRAFSRRHGRRTDPGLPLLALCFVTISGLARSAPLHTTYHWHLQQPIYWPTPTTANLHYETAYDSALRKEGGALHPLNDLEEIFSKEDRRAVYQYRVRDAIAAISQPDGGAQISYSGCLIENISALASHGKYGYSPGWEGTFQEARGWTTSGGRPKLDIVVFPFHHALAPLVDSTALRKELQIYKLIYGVSWGDSPPRSRGFFPPELAFSERIIPVLEAEGMAWTFVSNSHISRACQNFPVTFGSGGEMCDPPNRADQTNPAQNDWFSEQIDRGCSPTNALPFAYQPHRARFVDPETGVASSIVIVPVAMVMSWRDGYAQHGTEDLDKIAWANDPARPMLVTMAHDGDNAYGGGYSYYMESVPNFCDAAANQGYEPTVVSEFLADHPVPGDDWVHVEDGAWVNADGDFGSPQFWNWNWPPVDGAGQIDIDFGWAEDERNWAVVTAAENRVETAEEIAGDVDIRAIVDPEGRGASDAELSWHYLLPALTSGYMYYGTALDMEVKPTIACNAAVNAADRVIGQVGEESVAPTIWAPQRHPWNPGGIGFGAPWNYLVTNQPRDFRVWTFVYDVSGLAFVELHYRIDEDGYNNPRNDQNETYAGGPEVGDWRILAMTERAFPADNVYGDPNIDFFVMPEYIADQYTAHILDPDITTSGDVLVDYYVLAVDQLGNEKRSSIEHVYVGGDSGGEDRVGWEPQNPRAGDVVSIYYDAEHGSLPPGTDPVYIHIGHSGWQEVIVPDPAMERCASRWCYDYATPLQATSIDLVFNDGRGNWDNNDGSDWHIELASPAAPPYEMDGALDPEARVVASNEEAKLWADWDQGFLYLAATAASHDHDRFIFLAGLPGEMQAAPWAKSGAVAAWEGYLADEGMNDFVGWFDLPQGAVSGTGPGAMPVLEGYVRLTDLDATLAGGIYVALGDWGTDDHTPLLWQVPGAGPPEDGNLSADEFIRLELQTRRTLGSRGE